MRLFLTNGRFFKLTKDRRPTAHPRHQSSNSQVIDSTRMEICLGDWPLMAIQPPIPTIPRVPPRLPRPNSAERVWGSAPKQIVEGSDQMSDERRKSRGTKAIVRKLVSVPGPMVNLMVKHMVSLVTPNLAVCHFPTAKPTIGTSSAYCPPMTIVSYKTS